MAMQPHQHAAASGQAHRSHHAKGSAGAPGTVHPQRKYVAEHLRSTAAQVEGGPVAHAPMTPTEKTALRGRLAHARQHVAPPAA